MNGPEHFREAERLLELAAHPPQRVTPGLEDAVVDLSKTTNQIFHIPNDATVVDNTLAAAQVHATLALAASNVEPIHQWREALRTPEGTS